MDFNSFGKFELSCKLLGGKRLSVQYVHTMHACPHIQIFTNVLTMKMFKHSVSVASSGSSVNQNLASATYVVGTYNRVASGYYHSIALKRDGSVWAAGINKNGQLGDGSIIDRKYFRKIISSYGVNVAAGIAHSVVLKSDGSVWTTGLNNHGQLGDGSLNNSYSFKMVSSYATAVAAGGYTTLMVKQDGTVWMAGLNAFLDLDQEDVEGYAYHKSFIHIFTGAQALASGDFHLMILGNAGYLWVVGRNDSGQLGEGTLKYSQRLMAVLADVTAIAAGGSHSMALRKDGSVWTTGSNYYGQLGIAWSTFKVQWIQVVSSEVLAMAAGSVHSLIMKEDRSVWAAGRNGNGQLGDGTTLTRRRFVVVLTGGVVAVSAGLYHSMVVKNDGTLWATGLKLFGQGGDNSFTRTHLTFVRVAPVYYQFSTTRTYYNVNYNLNRKLVWLKTTASVAGACSVAFCCIHQCF